MTPAKVTLRLLGALLSLSYPMLTREKNCGLPPGRLEGLQDSESRPAQGLVDSQALQGGTQAGPGWGFALWAAGATEGAVGGAAPAGLAFLGEGGHRSRPNPAVFFLLPGLP